MVRVLFSASPKDWAEYEAPLQQAFDAFGLNVDLVQTAAPETIDYIVFTPSGPVTDLGPFKRLKAVLSLWAGVENMITNPTLTQPLARMVDPGLAVGMAEWVTGHILRYHLGLDHDIDNPDHAWTPRVPPLAGSQTVAILGMGALGQATAEMLTSVGFGVQGWARRENPAASVPVHTGEGGLSLVLSKADYVVLLMPLTAQTRNVINEKRIGYMKAGVRLINPGRGPLIDDEALLSALDAGHVDHATLDVFRNEPLPQTDPYWAHPKVTVTPHIASATRPDTASMVIAENIHRGENGLDFLHLVDRSSGY